eukprot:Tbor_TRINITY_DN3659_c0_g1::TRINITY_DN3659_c0_g1_i1::g.414::m.414
MGGHQIQQSESVTKTRRAVDRIFSSQDNRACLKRTAPKWVGVFSKYDETNSFFKDYYSSIGDKEACRTSCFLMKTKKERHTYERPEGAITLLQNEPYRLSEHLKNLKKQQDIIRFESTLPIRRVKDAYTNKLSAQIGIGSQIPTSGAALRRVHNGESWALNNTDRQLHIDGVPEMSRIMQGEYYMELSTRPHVPKKTNYIAINKARLRAISASSAQGRVSSVPSLLKEPNSKLVSKQGAKNTKNETKSATAEVPE